MTDRSFIWCMERVDGTILPIGDGKSLEYALEVKDGYSSKDLVLYKMVKVDNKGRIL